MCFLRTVTMVFVLAFLLGCEGNLFPVILDTGVDAGTDADKNDAVGDDGLASDEDVVRPDVGDIADGSQDGIDVSPIGPGKINWPCD